MQLTERVETGGGLIGACSVYCTCKGGGVVLYEFDEDTEKEFGGESRGSEE